MERIHFIHTSDWHLGFYQYNKHERFEDFRSAVEKTISKIIELEPQFVLHTGDIFHHSRPSPATIRQAVRQLQRLQAANIPIYIIRGNHDGKDSAYLKRGGGIISLLEDFGLVRYVKDRVVSVDENPAAILGVGYYPGRQVNSYIDEILEEENSFLNDQNFSIVAIHAFVEGQLEDSSQITLKKVKQLGVNYLGAGHYHIPWKDEKNQVFAPGSSETTAITDSHRGDTVSGVSAFSSFYEVTALLEEGNWSSPEITTHQVEVRPKINIVHQSEKETVTQIREELEKLVEEKQEIILDIAPTSFHLRPILSVDLETNLTFEENSQLYIEEWFEDEFLHVLTNIDGKSKMIDVSVELGTSQNREEVIIDLIRSHDLDENIHTSIIIDLLDEFGSYAKNKDLGDDEYQHIGKLLLQEEEQKQEQEQEQPERETNQPQGLDVLEELSD